jgi:hypothetical protein
VPLPLFGFALPSGAQTTTRLSPGLSGTGGDGNSRTVAISADGRSSRSAATRRTSCPETATPPTTSSSPTASRTRSSRQRRFRGTEGNAGSFSPSISANGRFVAFHSFASNLVPWTRTPLPTSSSATSQDDTTTRASLDSLGGEAHGDCL